MSRAQRLLDLIQILRGHRFPVAGTSLANELGISLRTLYRDIDTLKAQGAHIDGEPGVGYILRPGFLLPPLMFSEEEIEALVLGMRWVAQQPDRRLAGAARNALASIAAVLPADLRAALDSGALLVGPVPTPTPEQIDLALLRRAIRSEHKLALDYRDGKDRHSRRIVWPFAL